MSAYTVRCELGDNCLHTFEHPDEEDCDLVDGRCAHLMNAGWRMVTVKLFTDDRKRDIHIVSRGGWMCPACYAKYTPKKAAR